MLIISPKTKLMAVLEEYPQLEQVLINYVPMFTQLKNPVLRKTVARIATLQQVANIGKVPVEDLINRLRNEVGQDLYSGTSDTSYITAEPEGFDKKKISGELDIHAMLEAGEQPVILVLAELNKLSAGSAYKVSAPFLPAPLIDKAVSLNIRYWVKSGS
ncbi:MAG: DUF1858 domain-containing protein, partial [Candidatus Marinimicrobia bacterium]|nr:DUF1858 domain-containing protein [Candidatus Neomarinimicrobiota bacterium]